MLNARMFYIKDKQAFRKEEGVLRLAGNPYELAREAKKEGIALLHFIDLDAEKGLKTNFDVYDKLTYVINVEVEGVKDEDFIEKLLDIEARVVFELPTELNLKKWKAKKRLLVGKISGKQSIEDIKEIEDVYDVIIENPHPSLLEQLKDKRILVYEKDLNQIRNKKAIFAVIQ